MKNRKLVSDIALDGLFIAIIAILTFVPYIGFIPLGFVSVTIIHIPVILGAIVFGWKRGALYGTAFGLASLIQATQQPAGTLDAAFVNPVISVLPRLLFGIVSGLLASVLFKIVPDKKTNRLLISLVAFISTAFHTTFVFFALGIFHPEYFNWVVAGGFAFFMLFEGIAAALLVSVLYFALAKQFESRLLKYSEKEEDDDDGF